MTSAKDDAMAADSTSRRRIYLVLSLCSGTALAGALLWQSCAIERPGVGSEDYDHPRFVHAEVTATRENCNDCHEKDRPTPEHGSKKDCIGCHTPSDTKAGFLPATPFTHSPPPESCYPCHKRERPAPPHPAEGDCFNCHNFPSWKKLK
jgi:hypothetical protein